MLDNYAEIYRFKTSKSRTLFEHATERFPGGVSHNIRFFEPYPFFTERASGKYLYDIDGNRYTDYWMGHWSLILGHSHPAVVDALKKRVPDGTILGTVNQVSVELAEQINRLMPRAELVRFANTGAEATMNAVRLARAYTGKRVVAKIEGGWHGFNTTLLKSVNFPFEEDEGTGLLEDELKYVVSLPFNHLQESVKILESVKDDLACVIVEPLLGGAGCVPPDEQYLHGLQETCRKFNSLFVLDEIVTGFRLSLRGAQDLFSLEPDLFTLGKIVGGGMPIGVLCGSKDIMELASPKRKKKERCSIGGGTFSANPLTMAAGLAALKYLEENESAIYDKISELGELARKKIDQLMNEHKIVTKTTGLGSLFLTHFLTDEVSDVISAADVANCNRELQKAYHLALMAKYDVFFLPNKLGAISIMHEREDIENLVRASEELAPEIRQALQ